MAVETRYAGVLPDSVIPFLGKDLDENFPPAVERKFLNPIRYRTNYRVIPAYAIFCAVCLLTGVVLMSQDENRFWPVFVIALAAMAIVSVLLLLQVPKTRRAELEMEYNRYDLDPSHVPEETCYHVAYEGKELIFTADGVRDGDRFGWYNHLTPKLATSNKFNRVWIALQLGSEPLKSWFIPLDPVVLRAIRQFRIPLENWEDLDYLLEDPRAAMEQIYKTGKIQIPY